MTETWYQQIAIPGLLRHARKTYGRAMRGALERGGFDDIPANGLYIIGGLALDGGGVPIGQLVRDLGITKQGAGQLVDTLVSRGYLSRQPDPEDRRRLIVTLPDRGEAAAEAQTEGRLAVDAKLLAASGAEDVDALRRGLAALIGIGHA